MVALPQIRCQLHDHAKQYDNDGVCHDKRSGGKLHSNISRNGYGNAITSRKLGFGHMAIFTLVPVQSRTGTNVSIGPGSCG